MVFILIGIYCDLAPDLSTIARRLPLSADRKPSLFLSALLTDTNPTTLLCAIVCTAIELTIEKKVINRLMAFIGNYLVMILLLNILLFCRQLSRIAITYFH